jgi:hypothetical protein
MRTAVLLSLAILAGGQGQNAMAEEPAADFFHEAGTFRGTKLFLNQDNTAYMYETEHAAADADGAPNAYSPADLGIGCGEPHVGLDCLANAGYPKASWWPDVLVADPANASVALVQADGPFKGFFVSQTSLRKAGGAATDPATYVDAATVPYIVTPSGFPSEFAHAAMLGDVGVAILTRTGQAQTFIVADSGGGSDARLGEASIALFAGLGFPEANPRTGEGLPRETIRYIVFPKSRSPDAKDRWPRTNEDIHDQVRGILSKMPGIGMAIE